MQNQVTPVILTAKDLEVHFGEQIILNKASLSIHEGDRIGLVGRNGAGKSTFLKIISEYMAPDSGEVAKKKDLVVGFLTQEFTLNNSKNVYDNILEGAENISKLISEYESTPFDSPARDQLEAKIKELDAWNLEKSINLMIKALNAPDPEKDVTLLSGGEKRRVALCRALISKPDLLILDEPTNHLDTASIEWIENFLANYSGTCLFVTHDRYFLDRIATRIVELNNGEFYSHDGNYTDYLINKSDRLKISENEERKRQSFLRRELDWISRGPKARGTKAKHRIDKFYEVKESSNQEVELDVDLVIPPAERLGKNILELKNVGMTLGNKTLYEGLHFAFEKNRKLGIVGSNGVGKTTLIRNIIGELAPTIGQIDVGENTSFNYVNQSRIHLNENDTVLDAIGDGNTFVKFGKEELKVWTYLRRFLFTDERINTLVGRLSGGEKSRLTLAAILKNGGNFLLLDEPTNDLDLPTLRILEEALIGFEGCVVVVSHDRYFLNRVCNGILALEGDGNYYISEGNYDYYVEKKKRREKENIESAAESKKVDTRVKPQIRKMSWKEKKELEEIEENILVAESEVERIEAIFSAPDFYEKHADKSKELNDELEAAKLNVQQLYDRWEELEKIKADSEK